MAEPVRLEVWSDISCPWCYIAKRRLDQALAGAAVGTDLTVTYRSFQVSPDAPQDFEGSAFDFLVHHKGIPAAQVRQGMTQVARIAASVGLVYDVERLSPANTGKAHQVLHLARARGAQLAMVDRLFAAFFAEGRAISRDGVLAELAGDVGLEGEEVREVLRTGEFAQAVRADIDAGLALGLTGVPFYVIDGVRRLPATQAPETMAALLKSGDPTVR
ncbi:DsbA family protein [Actinomadura sp. BRA 177]|uniref:DsbA family oxidoreductase n=1 Tax=Actinomadura sp. BRA 177 TaxID=2745202 RepID=UPI0015961E01|nr:DsbA family oxidoreductase [Actinomadura sp. BRA 177]NVI91247.1 DsbA family oxidoreductase [Actinomadura sp. BRA 177]